MATTKTKLDEILDQPKEKKRTASRSATKAQQGRDAIQAKIAAARRCVTDSIKAQIIGGGIADALVEIAEGNFGEVGGEIIESFDSFIEGIEAGATALEAAEADPQYLLAPSHIPFAEIEALSD